MTRHCVFFKVETELLYFFFSISVVRGLNILARFQISKKCVREYILILYVSYLIFREVIDPLKKKKVIIILTSIILTLASLKATGPRFSIVGQDLSKSIKFRKRLDKISERGFSTSNLLQLFTPNSV